MFLPITKQEVEKRGWDYVDIILVSGDAYIDHPSFGTAVIGRTLENAGFRVAIVAQPNWRDDLRDFKKMGKPRLFFGVTSGSMDSMVNHYTAARRLRSDDAYTPNNEAGFRPDYATTVYSKILKELYPDTPLIIGGIEASMRRLAHYDYWEDRLFPSILIDSKADMLVYGMGEKVIVDIANRLSKGEKICEMISIPQTAFVTNNVNHTANDSIVLPSFEQCRADKKQQAQSMKIIEQNANAFNGKVLVQSYAKQYVIVNPMDNTFCSKDLDKSFDLPYMREPHPKYKKRGSIVAFEMIKHSVNIHRGCFGGCSFCTIAAHQGKRIISRSEGSILKEIKAISQRDDFKGYLTDLGGPSANMYKMEGRDRTLCEKCTKPSCIFPSVCKNMNNDHNPLLKLYEKVRGLPYIKKVFIGSGIRYDIFTDYKYFDIVFLHHVSGRLKVAPEHTSDKVLNIMRKPSFDKFVALKKRFDLLNMKHNMKQQLIPYFISSHPASTMEDMADLVRQTAKLGYKLEQVQDFTPTPMTISTEIYYTGYNPMTMEKVYCAKTKEEKAAQNRIFFWYKKGKH
jgi:uncharacterized radical SAM protein YgiQ